ncbi:MAG: YitT family protein [Candidatus Gastranaerophilales bacterium]|nr:YitT family protein [Candidatus Gastranaerophilales bacterium]
MENRIGQEQKLQEKEKRTGWRLVRDYLVITVSALLYAVAISLFLDPNSLAPGGVSGISIILSRVVGLPTGTWILLLNIPILTVGAWKFGGRFILSTVYSTVMTSFFTNTLADRGAVTNDPLLAALCGSALIALALGWTFKAGGTTGGMDIIIKLLRLRFPYLRTGFLFLLIDIMVVSLSAFVFQNVDQALYAGIVVYMVSVILDLVLYGKDGAKLIYVISDQAEAIARRILEELDIGVTYIQGAGAYSGKEKRVILCVLRKNLSPKAEEIIRREDPEAFLIVSSASEIYGEGYKNIFSEKL